MAFLENDGGSRCWWLVSSALPMPGGRKGTKGARHQGQDRSVAADGANIAGKEGKEQGAARSTV